MKQKNSIIIFILVFVAGAARAQQWGDYTLYSVMNSTSAYLLDTNGNTVNTWAFPVTKKTGYSSFLMPGGYLWRSVAKSGNFFSGGPICGEVQVVDYNGTVVWDYIYSTTTYCSHHDICPMPNGNVLLIAYESKTPAEVVQAGCSQSITMWPDKIVEVQPTGPTTGTVVWEWHAWDHLCQNVNPSKDNYYPSIVDHPELIDINYNTQQDWMHMNGVDYNPILDQITFSAHNLHEIYVIDHSTTTAEAAGHTGGNSGKGGDILYRWGHPDVYSAAGTQILNVVHDAHWIPEGVPNAGRLACFNNKGVSNSQSAVDEIIPPLSGYVYTITPGAAFLPATYTERHACSGYTSHMGSSQQLPNGNTLVCIASSGYIYEIDSNGTTIWYKNISGAVPQSFRYDTCFVNHPAPAIPVITLNGNDLDAGSATTWQWYLNGVLIPGATSQTYTPLQNGIYVVRITDANGCVYRYSHGYTYPGASGLPAVSEMVGFNMYPNPSGGLVKIEDSFANGSHYVITVTDISGKVVLKKENSCRLDLSHAGPGLYFVNISGPVLGSVTQKLTLLR